MPTFTPFGTIAPMGAPAVAPRSLPIPRSGGVLDTPPPSEGPAAPGQVQVIRAWFRWSDGQKIRFLKDFAKQYGREPEMRYFVVEHVLHNDPTMQRDYAKQAAALLSWIQQNILYLNESGEVLQNPWVTIKKKVGDCDDEAILLAAMAESIALPWRYVLAGRDKRTGKPVRWMAPPGDKYEDPPRGVDWVHIYVAFGDKPFGASRWIPAEPTIKGAPLGYDPTQHGPYPDAHMRGRWTGTLPELAGWGATAPGQTNAKTIQEAEAESFDWRAETRDVVKDGIKFGISGVIAGIVGSMLYSESKKRKR